MKAFTVRQPTANRIISGEKDVENRKQRFRVPGTVAVHASKTLADYADEFPVEEQQTWVRGAVIGVVDIVECVQSHPSPWFQGPNGYVLENPRLLPTPIPCSGALGFWEVPPEVEEQIHRQLKKRK